MSHPTLESILATHGHADNSFDIYVHPLLEIVQSIINRSTRVVDRNLGNMKVQEETTDEMFKSPNINLPFCKLKAISCELSTGSCKLAGEVREDVAHAFTLSILKKLSNCSWEAKAVLTAAAFALDYGEFWHLVEPHQSDHLAKPLAILKGASVLLKKPAELQKGHQIAEFNRLIMKTLQVIQLIYELEKFSYSYNSMDVPELAKASKIIPVAVYWAIRTTLACATNIAIFIAKDHEDKSAGDLDLLITSVQKINGIADDLKINLSNCKEQIVPVDTHVLLVKLFNWAPFRINEVLNAMIFGNNIERIQKYEAQTYEAVVNIAEGLEGKKVLWFFSNVDDVSDDYINKVVIPSGEKIKKEIIEQYQIVWIPIVYKWTNEAKEKFNQLVKNKKWFSVQYFSLIAGIRFINIEWQFKGKPMVVVTSSQGKVEYRNNALAVVDQISIWDYIIPQPDPTYPEWFRPFEKYTIDIDKDIISAWINEEKCIFFYGGTNEAWIKEFEEKAKTINEQAKAELVHLNKISSQLAGQFWSTVENLFLSLIKMDSDNREANKRAIAEVQKLICHRNEEGWAILFKGLNVVTSGNATTIRKVLDDFENWRPQLTDSKFEDVFKENHDKVVTQNSLCHRFEIEKGSEKDIPSHALHCPSCPRDLRTFLSFKCCHEKPC